MSGEAAKILHPYPNDRNDKLPFIRRRGGGLKQWVRLLANFTKYTCARSTFICFLMILTQGIGQTIYQQAVRLIEVGQ